MFLAIFISLCWFASIRAAYGWGTGYTARQRAKAEKKRIDKLPKAYRK